MILTLLLACAGPPCVSASSAAAFVHTSWQDEVAVRERMWLEEACEAASWLRSVARETEAGLTWPVVPAEAAHARSNAYADTLYAGSPGVVLFFLELHRATGDPADLAVALAGADELVAKVPSVEEARILGQVTASGLNPGLYLGVAGQGHVFLECWRSSGEVRFRSAAELCAELVHGQVHETERGRTFNYSSSGLIDAESGAGLFLLESAARLGRPQDLELASDFGRCMIESAGGRDSIDWIFTVTRGEAAGPLYFLTRLYEVTGDEAFLDAALAPDTWLADLHAIDRESFPLMHDASRDAAPVDMAFFAHGWFHTPFGNERLIEVLRRATSRGPHARRFAEWAAALRRSALPEPRLGNPWDGVGRCCGAAGVAWFYLERFETSGESEDLELALGVARDLVMCATRDERGSRWLQGWHRSHTELLNAQTGLMQGAAGIGLLFLRLDALESGRDDRLRLLDDPF